MRVHVENDIYLSASGYGYSLERKQVIKEGKTAGTESFVPFKYYATIKGCINGLVNLKIAELPEDKVTTLKELLEAVEGIRLDIETKVLI